MKRIIRDKRQQLIWKESSWRAKVAETRTYGVKVAAKQETQPVLREFSAFSKLSNLRSKTFTFNSFFTLITANG